VVEGHTDSHGSALANEGLSYRRAESVRTYLVMRGLRTDQVEVQAFGESRPVADNTTADGRANNRRVEIVVRRAADLGVGGSGAPPR
jgi:outer membrane protein OmpA-like peptidoglycan-associated protein